MVWNPIDVRSGNKFQEAIDFSTTGLEPLTFRRYYNSLDTKNSMFARKWRSDYDISLLIGSSGVDIRAQRNNGKSFHFVKSGGVWNPTTGEEDAQLSLAASGSDWILTRDDQTVETYDSTGKLTSIEKPNGYTRTLSYDGNGDLATVIDSYGRQISFTFNGQHKVTKVTAPDGKEYKYLYNVNRLSQVIYPDATTSDDSDNPKITYLYENTDYTPALTGITDENGARFATWSYDADGKGITSEHAGGADKGTNTYNVDGTITATNAPGKQAKYHVLSHAKGDRISKIEGLASTNCAAADSDYAFDTNGYVSSITDREGNVTTIVNNSRGLPTSITEADETPDGPDERITTYTWHASFRKPTKIEQAGRVKSEFTYDATTGDLLSLTETDLTSHSIPYSTNGQTRQWSYTYTYNVTYPDKLDKLEVDGPRSGTGDTTTYEYDTNGYLTKVTNALSQVTDIVTVNGLGLPTRIQDPNGIYTDLTYDERGRLTERTVDPGTGEAVTAFTYDGVGQVTKITLPNGATLNYSYDDAHRLIEVSNGDGEKIVYTLNDLGNVTKEDIKSASAAIRRTQSRTFDELGRMMEHIGAGLQTTSFEYNKNDLRTKITDPKTNATNFAFDGLNRLKSITDPLTNVASVEQDATDNPTKVTDQRALETTYVYNGFGDAIRRTSPDTGITDYEYDSAGNLTKRTDARSVVTQFTYDNLNRRSTKTFPASSPEDVTYTYDDVTGGNKGKGRLTKVEDQSGSTAMVYDARGNITKETRTIGSQVYTTEYAYDLADNLTQVTYPSGRIVAYTRDSEGRVILVTMKKSVTDPEQFLVANIAYRPFGPVATVTFGNGHKSAFTYDQDYRLTAVDTTDGISAAVDLDYGYDAASNVSSITDNLDVSRNQTFVNDALNRLTDATGVYGDIDFVYDAVGNRTSRVIIDGGTTTETLTYASTSNRLLSHADGTTTRNITYTAAGNITTDSRGGGFDFIYNNANRLSEVKEASTTVATHTYNDFGQRVVKAIPAGATTHYHYDLDGTLIAESTSLGANIREYVALGGMPVAVIDAGTTPSTPTETTVDNDGVGASSTGTWITQSSGTGFEGSDYETKSGGTGTESFTWTPTVSATGAYRVYAKWPGNTTRSSNADYTVHHAGGSTQVTLDQRSGGGDWNLLGLYTMQPSSSHRVVLSDKVDAMAVSEAVVDNTHPDASSTGTWLTSTTMFGYQGVDYVYHAAGSGTNEFTWPTAVPETGRYKIYAKWMANATLASNAKYTVHHAGGTTMVTVDQRYNKKQWNLLGAFEIDPDSASGHKVVLNDDADSYVVADALRFVRDDADVAATQTIVDNDDLSVVKVGTWGTSNGSVSAEGISYNWNASGSGADTFTWPANISVAGNYRIYTKWVSGTASTRATNAPYTIHHAGGTTTINANQQVNDGQWYPLGTYSLTPASGHKVVLSDNANSSYVIADAIKYERDPTATAEIIVDNTSATTTGTWVTETWTGGGQFWGSNYQRVTTPAGQTMTWTPTLVSSGIYRVYARWVSYSAYAPDAPYTIHHADGSTTVRVDQRYDGGRWMSLGEFTLQPGQNHRVVLTQDAAANVQADAVRLVRVGSARLVQADAVKIVPNTAEDALYVHTDHLGTPRKMTDDARAVVWDADYRPFGEVDSITGRAANDNRFPGQYADAASALYYNWNRHYDPTLGRYIQSDPIGLAGGLNTYGYVNGNPVNATDRTGLICGFGACVTGAVVAYRGYQAYRAYRSIRAAAAAARAAAAAVARARAPLTLGLAVAATQICSIANILSTMSPIASLPQGVLNEGAGDTEEGKADGGVGQDDRGHDRGAQGSSPDGDPDRNPAQDKKITKSDVRKLKNRGVDPEDLKGGKRTGSSDIFKDRKGNLYEKPKSGIGYGEFTGINLNDL